MKSSLRLAAVAFLASLATAACLDAGPAEPESTEPEEAPTLSETEQNVEACPASYGCILTAIRDGNYFLIDTCIAVLCGEQQQ